MAANRLLDAVLQNILRDPPDGNLYEALDVLKATDILAAIQTTRSNLEGIIGIYIGTIKDKHPTMSAKGLIRMLSISTSRQTDIAATLQSIQNGTRQATESQQFSPDETIIDEKN